MVDIDEIMESIKLGDLARHLLKTRFKNKSVEELRGLEEKEVEKLCSPYDPALIVALCIRIIEREQIGAKELH